MYYNLLTACKLNSYLANINQQAEEMFSRLVKEHAEKEGINEQLKATNQMKWVRKMNAIQSSITDVVLKELIFL